jgi:HD-like signal output (HDOD) protein
MIPRGKFDWYSPEKTMGPLAASLFNKIGGLKDLPHISMAVMEIQEGLQKAEIDVPALSKKVRQDPLLAAELLETANNIKFSRDPGDRKKIDSIEHAIMYIGTKAFSELVMTISLKSFVAGTTLFNADRFWKESFVIADLAEAISTRWGSASVIKDEIYISAALCNIGKIVGAIATPGNIDKVEAMVNNPKTLCTWPQAEALLKFPSHALLGEVGAAIWGLPKYVLEAISSHHGSTAGLISKSVKRPDKKLLLWETVALANQMSHWILLRPSRMDQALLNQICAVSNISSKDIEDFATAHAHLAARASL